jgi:ABC-type taurine transport system ATPase subunit
LLHQPSKADRTAVTEALERVGMAGEARTQIGRLSGGQRRRAFLARAIAAEPELYLLDEPVTGVDVPTQEDLMALLTVEAGAGRTIVATTHDLAAVRTNPSAMSPTPMPNIQTSLLTPIPARVGQMLPGSCRVGVRRYIVRSAPENAVSDAPARRFGTKGARRTAPSPISAIASAFKNVVGDTC